MAKVDNITLKNFTSYLNMRSNSTKIGDATNPARTFLSSLGITESADDLLYNNRTPVWFLKFVDAARERNNKNISVAAARQVLQAVV